MSKAEERALEKYPKKIEQVGNQWEGAPFDVNSESRVAYKQGYHQAEKDLALTIEDVENIDNLLWELSSEWSDKNDNAGYFQEVLNRFNKQKEKQL